MRIICGFGDSVMKGVVVDKDNSPKDGIKYKVSDKGFVARCRRRLGIEIENFARFGSVVTHGIKYVNRYADSVKKADYVLLEYGGNDCNYNWAEISAAPDAEHLPATPLPEFVKHYSALIDCVRSLGGTPVMLSLPALAPEKFFTHLSKGLNGDNILHWLNGSISNLERWHERYNIEIFHLGLQKRVPVIDITSVFLERRNYSDYLCDDGIHPNDAGHELIENAIISCVKRWGVSW